LFASHIRRIFNGLWPWMAEAHAPLFTRLSTIPLVFSLSVAAFIHHSGDPFRNKELAFLFLLIFFTLFLTGPGSYSLHKGLNIKSRLSKKLDFILQ
jgi:hypothetical protein